MAREYFRRPGTWTIVIASVCVLALAAGFLGVNWYLDRDEVPSPPAADQTTTPSATVTPAGPIVVHGTGDVNLDPRQLRLIASGNYDAPWTGVRELFRADDVSVINLECSPGNGGVAQEKQFTFQCPRGFAAMLDNGVEVANLGNNHGGDYGKQALVEGIDTLKQSGVAPVGAGRNAVEAHAPAILETKGRTIAVIGFGGVIPERGWIATDTRPGMADGDDIVSMVAAVKAADAVADLVFVAIHWGVERDAKPRPDDVGRARAMIDAGADAIFGHHAHRLQPLEWYKGRPIFYGLGNFVWPAGGPTAVAEATFPVDGPVRACLLPGYISGGRPSLTRSSCQPTDVAPS